MKLSEIRGAHTIDVIANLIEPIANIAADEEAAAFFKRKQKPDGMTVKEYALQRTKESLPALLKNHKKDIISILAAINEVDPLEYEKTLDFGKLFKDATDIMTDQAFIELFISAQTQTSSGSALENTEEAKA